jgi:hypothetical protein
MNLIVKATEGLYKKIPTPAPSTPPTPPGAPTFPSSPPTIYPSYVKDYYELDNSLITGDTADRASPFLLYALKLVYDQETSAKKIIATIYLSKGTHYFYTCNSDYGDAQFLKKPLEQLYNYCDNLGLYMKYYNLNDNFDITIKPLECKDRDVLINDKENYDEVSAFNSLCVNLGSDPKPLIMVNNPYSYFNVTGKMTF